MTDAEVAAQKERVLRYAAWWSKFLGLNYWRITWNWHRESLPDSPQVRAGGTAIMRCLADWRYLEATISVGLPDIEELEGDRLEMVVVHELCHVLVREMREWETHESGLDHEERVCSSLSKALLWVRDQAREEAVSA
jgi:hypothetical protein